MLCEYSLIVCQVRTNWCWKFVFRSHQTTAHMYDVKKKKRIFFKVTALFISTATTMVPLKDVRSSCVEINDVPRSKQETLLSVWHLCFLLLQKFCKEYVPPGLPFQEKADIKVISENVLSIHSSEVLNYAHIFWPKNTTGNSKSCTMKVPLFLEDVWVHIGLYRFILEKNCQISSCSAFFIQKRTK